MEGGQDVRMSGDQNVRLSDCNIIMWLGYQVAKMSECQVVATSGNLGRGSYMVGSSRNCIQYLRFEPCSIGTGLVTRFKFFKFGLRLSICQLVRLLRSF